MNPASKLHADIADAKGTHRGRRGLNGRTCLIVPLLDNALPLLHRQTAGRLDSWEPPNVELESPAVTGLGVGTPLAVGILGKDDEYEFLAVVVDQVTPIETNKVRIQGHLGGVLREILERDLIGPQLDLQSLRFEDGGSDRVLRRLANLGVLERTIVDRIQVCPNCAGLPVYRSVCHACHSSNVSRDELIHHFACAYVAPVSQFRQADVLQCPKCQLGPLIVGADFEYLPGLYSCLDCRRAASQLEVRARCLICRHDFSLAESQSHDLIGFRPRRLAYTDRSGGR